MITIGNARERAAVERERVPEKSVAPSLVKDVDGGVQVGLDSLKGLLAFSTQMRETSSGADRLLGRSRVRESVADPVLPAQLQGRVREPVAAERARQPEQARQAEPARQAEQELKRTAEAEAAKQKENLRPKFKLRIADDDDARRLKKAIEDRLGLMFQGRAGGPLVQIMRDTSNDRVFVVINEPESTWFAPTPGSRDRWVNSLSLVGRVESGFVSEKGYKPTLLIADRVAAPNSGAQYSGRFAEFPDLNVGYDIDN